MIGPDGRMTEEAGEFAGLTAAEAQDGGGRRPARRGPAARPRSPTPTRSRSRTAPGERIEPLISLQWFCRMDELAEPAIEVVERDEVRIAPGAVEARLPRLDAGDPPLVHLAPALVGAPDPGLVLRRVRGDDRRRERARALRRLRRRAAPGGGRARHLVQLGDLAVRDARLARRHAGAARLLPDQLPHHGARDPLPLGGADDHDRDRVRRRRPVPRRLRALGDPGPRRAADVEEPRHRDRPAGGDRRPRRRRAALRPAGDVLDPGRALLRRQGPAGPRPREQALERQPADPAERTRRGRAEPPSPRRTSRTAGSSRGWSGRSPRSPRSSRPTTSPTPSRRPTRSSGATSATGTWRSSSRASTTARRRSRRRCSTCSSGSWRCCTRRCPSSPRRSGPSTRPARGHLVVHPFPEADESLFDAGRRGGRRGRDRPDPAAARLARPRRRAGRRRCWSARDRRGRAARVRRPPRPLRVRRGRRRAGRLDRPGPGPRLRAARRRGGRGAAGRSAARSCGPRSSAASASSATRASSPRRRPRWSRRSAASSSATGPNSRSWADAWRPQTAADSALSAVDPTPTSTRWSRSGGGSAWSGCTG